MAQINAIAHLNELTTEVTNDYYLTPQVRDTLYTPDIIARISKREIATKNVDGEQDAQPASSGQDGLDSGNAPRRERR